MRPPGRRPRAWPAVGVFSKRAPAPSPTKPLSKSLPTRPIDETSDDDNPPHDDDTSNRYNLATMVSESAILNDFA